MKSAALNLRISPELKEQIRQAAAAENRTISNLIETVMQEWLEYDPTPWCHICGAPTQAQCKCGPYAANH